jgi:hypothetical protein
MLLSSDQTVRNLQAQTQMQAAAIGHAFGTPKIER